MPFFSEPRVKLLVANWQIDLPHRVALEDVQSFANVEKTSSLQGLRPGSLRGELNVGSVPNGCGAKLNRRGYAGFGPCFHLPGIHFGTGFLSHSQMTTWASGSVHFISINPSLLKSWGPLQR